MGLGGESKAIMEIMRGFEGVLPCCRDGEFIGPWVRDNQRMLAGGKKSAEAQRTSAHGFDLRNLEQSPAG